ncbi:PD-(D/E)XK nuclease family protein [Aquimarina sp. U1-2]|uniref:PD-(D/E)XK nuclease family protein n=1 Tax=Aquimarina sp. U1-2 TaxID=2823141 RepID=UPI001AEC84A7|nr:PD-(D/E)XK nuclease family protein [Aquimarina sp. U1-2]MBP2831172.1 PD-(D/E)XK nuclease family protein [Aquimarina sp. U1-2]
MKTFLKEVLQELHSKDIVISDHVFLVPSKRAGLFLKKEMAALYSGQTIFVPEIYSIEEFITQVSGLEQIEHTQALFEFYETYLEVHSHLEKESFETFSNWAQTLINDFNEIDRYCIDHKSFFSYLSNIQDLNHWYLQKEKTQLIQNYILFWESLLHYYEGFKDKLISKNMGYQGLLYRKASEDIHKYIQKSKKRHILIGFNALNNAEQIIFQAFLASGFADVYWDCDQFFMNNEYHEAALFLRNYRDQWEYYKSHPFTWINNTFSDTKKIQLIGAPKNVGQAKSISKILSAIPASKIENTALVLADESLMQPLLNALPNTINSINITMGLPLKEVPTSGFFEMLFNLQKNINPDKLYFNAVVEILTTLPANRLLGRTARELVLAIRRENIVYVSLQKLQDQVEKEKKEILHALFHPWKNVTTALSNLKKLIYHLKANIDTKNNVLELEYIYHFHLVFNKLTTIHSTYPYMTTMSALYMVYQEIVNTASLDFSGEPFQGLQFMGMLESRCLDFETVIISSVNEGILPAGKSANSFIPYDLKRAYNLPTYKEKDAIYTYHFYRLIQRAKNIYLVYNTENEGIGSGEKSRFLFQLDIDKRPKHTVNHYTVVSEVPQLMQQPLQIKKNTAVLQKLQQLAMHGLSPSALTTYIRNPIDFYYKYVLDIREMQEVEETIAANTLGTVIHNALETFYQPFEHKLITLEYLAQMKKSIGNEIKKQFKKEYSTLDITSGKNLLIFEVAKRYVYNFLSLEEKLLQNGSQLKMLSIENNLKAQIDIPEFDFPVYIKGKVDRIDLLDNTLRIIDYKTGKVTRSDVVFTDWSDITKDYKYSKAVQVLTYGLMYYTENNTTDPFQAGIISFKNLQEGFIKFGTKEHTRSQPDHEVTAGVLDTFKAHLKALIIEIFDPNTPFIEKEIR